ncbi:MAG: hypothetical protein L6Q57_05555 [Alphaproteobacteria bacterium]|nr:hypothetical protein [Alphaproteobacteria bacterium]
MSSLSKMEFSSLEDFPDVGPYKLPREHYELGPKEKGCCPPYNNPALDALFQKPHDGYKMSDEPHAIRDVAIVGGIINSKGLLCTRDLSRIGDTLCILNDMGLPIHPKLRIWIYNLLRPLNSDFLKAASADYRPQPHGPEQIDVVISAFIYNGNGAQSKSNYRITSDLQEQQSQSGGIWGRAAQNLGAKFIFTFGQVVLEIHTGHFSHGGAYKTLISTEENYDDDRDSIGICIAPDIIAKVQTRIRPKSDLAIHLIDRKKLVNPHSEAPVLKI